MTHRLSSYKEGFTNCTLPLDRHRASPICRSPIACAFVNEDELVREVRKGHMLTKFLALELVAFDCNLRQLQAAISKRSTKITFQSLTFFMVYPDLRRARHTVESETFFPETPLQVLPQFIEVGIACSP